MRNALRIAAVLMAFAAASFATVTVSSPASGTTATSPVHFVASATSSYTVTAMMIYVDNISVYNVSGSKLDTYVNMSAGAHWVVVQSWDSTGAVQKNGFNLTVSTTTSGSGGGSVPSGAKVYSNVDQMTGWQSCNSCAGPGGAGAAIPYSMQQNISSPSMDGNSVQFNVGGTSRYGAALWWKQLGANSAASNFVYDTYFYIKNPTASQALEFDVNQSVNGKKFIFGTECNYKGTKQWDIWDNANARWVATGIPCNAPTAYTWHHVVLEFQRTSGGQAKFIAVTLDGVKSYINRSNYPRSSSVQELNVAFQMDENSVPTPYSVWLDQVKLSAW